MIVVADASPVHYLVLIGAVNVLEPLYGGVLVPQVVANELTNTYAPAVVRTWMNRPPSWCEIRLDPPTDPSLPLLDPGERAAISLALSIKADRLLIDDLAGRTEAERLRLRITGTLGVLADAHVARLLDFEQALAHLRTTSFRLHPDIEKLVRRRIDRETPTAHAEKEK